jgi:hypothetical protein
LHNLIAKNCLDLLESNALEELENKHRIEQAESSPALAKYFSEEEGKMAKDLRKENVGIMPWSTVLTGKKRIHLETSKKDGLCELQNILTESVRKEADDCIVEDRLASVLFSSDIMEVDQHSVKSRILNLLTIQGLEPVVLSKSTKSGWEIVLFNSMISVHAFHSGPKNSAVRKTKEDWLRKVMKNIEGKTMQEVSLVIQEMKSNQPLWSDWEELQRNQMINMEKMNWMPQALLDQKEAFGPACMIGWTMFSSPRKRHVTSKQSTRKESMLVDSKNKIKDVENVFNANINSDLFSEVWVLDRKSWIRLSSLVLDRLEEVLSFFCGLGCDVEGHGCTVQLSGLSKHGTVSWLFVGGFLPRELAEYLWDKKPWIFEGGADFEWAFGNRFDIEVYDPDLWMRDIPLCQERFGIDYMAEFSSNCDVSWVKHKLKLHFGKKKDYRSMTNDELLYGLTRVGVWNDPLLVDPEMRVYAVLDSEIEVKAAVLILGLSLSAVHLKDLPDEIDMTVLLNRFSWSRNMRLNSSMIQMDASKVIKGEEKVLPGKNFVRGTLAKARANARTPCPVETRDSAWDRCRNEAAKAMKGKSENFEKQHSGRTIEIKRRLKNGQITV